MKSVHLRLDDELLQAVARAARRLGVTRSRFARKVLRQAITELRVRQLEQERAHKRKLRERMRQGAMKGYTKQDEDFFESLAGEPFENR